MMAKQFYVGGSVLTMEAPLYAEAVLVEDGRIAAVGRRCDLAPLAGDAQKIDLAGAVLLPAFIDPHSHFSGYANSLLQASVEDAQNFDDIRARIQSFLAENEVPAGKWVSVKGLDPTHLAEHTSPDRHLLDEAAPHNPVLLQHQSGHNGVFNTLALQELGITAQTPVPDGGRIAVENGEPTGYLEENAFIAYMQKLPMPTPQELGAAFEKAQQRYASYGITTVQDGMLMDMMAGLYQYLCAADALKLDVVGYADLRDSKQLLEIFHDHIDQYKNHFKIGGYKTFLDGSPQARTAWMRQPYEGAEDGYCGYPTLSDEQLLANIRRALREGRQLLAHCNGDAAAQQYIDQFTKALGELDDAPDIRPVMIHAQLLGKDQMPAMKEIGMMPSFFVAHVYHWGDAHLQNFGPQRAGAISAAKSAGELGLPYTFHQDAPVIEPNMLETVWCAVNRLTKKGVLLGPEERITPLEALRAVTVNAAYQYFEEREKGSIRPGKRADLVILDADPTKVDPMAIRDIKVLATIKDGACIYRA